MDHINEYMATASQNLDYSEATHAALALGKRTLNRYYDKTDHSEVYWIAMGTLLPDYFRFFTLIILVQSSIRATSLTTSRRLDGMMLGLRLHTKSYVLNLTKHTHLWISTPSLLVRLLVRPK